MNELGLKKDKKILIHLVLIIGVITTVIPFIWMILTSLKTLGESTQIPPEIFPSVPQWGNYKEAIDTSDCVNMDTCPNIIVITFYAMSRLILVYNVVLLEINGLTGTLLPVNLLIISFIPSIFITLFIL